MLRGASKHGLCAAPARHLLALRELKVCGCLKEILLALVDSEAGYWLICRHCAAVGWRLQLSIIN